MARWIAVFLASTLWWGSCSCSGSADSPGPAPASTQRMVVGIARTHPCVAVALLHVLRSGAPADEGTFYLREIPPPRVIALMAAYGISDDVMMLSAGPNPYADTFLVEVRWSAQRRANRSVWIGAQAQLVDAAGVPLRPAHVVESRSSVLVSEDGRTWTGPMTSVPLGLIAEVSHALRRRPV
jgi:hypothetical protein